MQEPGTRGAQPGAAPKYKLWFSLLIPALLLGLGRGFTAPVLPVIARDEFLISVSAGTLLIIAPMAGSAIATLPTGYLLDRFGRRQMLIGGPVLTAVSSFLVYFAGSFELFLAFLVLNGIALQMWQMGRLAAIADTGKLGDRGRQITSMNGLQRLGALLGPFLGGLAGEFIGLRVPFLMYGVLALLATIPMVVLMKETSPAILARRRGETVQRNGADVSWRKLLTFPVIVLFVAQFTANMGRGGGLGNTNPFFFFAAFAFAASPAVLGTVSLVTGIITVPLTFLAGYIMDRFGRKRTVVPSSAVLGAGLGFMALVAVLQLPFSAFIVAFIWVNVAIAMMSGSMQTIGSDVAPAEARGKFFGVLRLIGEGGSLSNPSAFGLATLLVAGTGGFALAFAIMGASGFATALLIGILLKETLVREPARAPTPAPRDPTTPPRP